jgi:glycerol-3-phosphate dehydrogenase
MGRLAFSEIHEKTFDVLVIGAGINGISAARHLVSLGYHVLLIDRSDFASGATGNAGRLLSNGVEYLDFEKPLLKTLTPRRLTATYKMVKATLEGRAELAKRDTGRVQSVRLYMPVYKNGPCSPWRLHFGLFLHSSFSPRDAKLAMDKLTDDQVRQMPMLGWLRAPEELQEVIAFREYFMDWPERIALDVLLDAERLGVKVRNYTNIESTQEGADGFWLVTLKDALDETSDERAAIKARLIVNTTGPWVDRINRHAKRDSESTCVGVKASYIAVRFPQDSREIGLRAFSRDARLFSILPWRGMHLIGPRLTPHQGEMEGLHASDEEIDWLLGETNFLMPILGVRPQDVYHSWATVLPRSNDPLSLLGNCVTEIHDVTGSGLPMLSLTAGDFAAHRKTGSDIAAAVRKRVRATGKPQSLGWKPQEPTERRHGRHVSDGQTSISLGALRYAAENEHAMKLPDYLFRRLGAGWNSTMAQGLAHVTAAAVGETLGWDDEQIDKQAQEYDVIVRTFHRVQARSVKESQLE